MTEHERIASGATGSYAATVFVQGMASVKGFAIAVRAGGVVLTSQWAKPHSERAVQDFVRKHGGVPTRKPDFTYG